MVVSSVLLCAVVRVPVLTCVCVCPFVCSRQQERLDFSCAVFGQDGGLVANAPHIPVHLGAMQETVQMQVRENMQKRDFPL